MLEPRNTTHLWLPVIIIAALLATMVTWTGCKKQVPESKPNLKNPQPDNDKNKPNPEAKIPEPTTENNSVVATDTNPPTVTEKSNKPTLQDIVKLSSFRGYWGQAFTQWYGKKATDFTLTDVNGKKHKLSDHFDKKIILCFWATWCPPCRMTVPHLKDLREKYKEDDLAIFALSFITSYPPNTAEMIKSFADDQDINYVVLPTDAGDVGAPYSTVSGLPSFFFIEPEGKIKFAASGLLSLGEFNAILEADPL